MSITFDGERIELVEDQPTARDIEPAGEQTGRRVNQNGEAHAGPNVRRIGNDERCGGGRRVIRKAID